MAGTAAWQDELRAARAKADMNLEELGERVGLHKTTISKYERGTMQRPPEVGTLEMLEDELGVTDHAIVRAAGYRVDPIEEAARVFEDTLNQREDIAVVRELNTLVADLTLDQQRAAVLFLKALTGKT